MFVSTLLHFPATLRENANKYVEKSIQSHYTQSRRSTVYLKSQTCRH